MSLQIKSELETGKPLVYLAMSTGDNGKIHGPFESPTQANAYFRVNDRYKRGDNLYLFAYRIDKPTSRIGFDFEKCYYFNDHSGFVWMENVMQQQIQYERT